MKWETYTDSIRRHREAYRLMLPWLAPSDVDACYTVVHNEYENLWSLTFWHGNRGHWLGNEWNLNAAKGQCESHLLRMYERFRGSMEEL